MTDPEPRAPAASVDEATAIAPPTEPFEPARSRGVAPWVVGVALLAVTAASVIGWFDLRRGIGNLRNEVALRHAQDENLLSQVKTRDAELASEVQDLRTKQAALEGRVAETASQQAALDALYRDLAPSRDAIALSEVEQILVLASQQLSLAGNVPSALAAVQLADGKLARLDRRFQRFLRDLWSELKSVVRIEVSDRPLAPLVSPEQAYFLKENLRLRLLSARLALLARDAQAFKMDVNATAAWVKQYFDLQAKPVQDLVATLTQLSATPMPASLPDLSQSLEIVQTLKAAGGQAPPARPK